jgi:hypothetical protein
MDTQMDSAAVSENPFFVLELPVSAGNHDIARQKQKLLGMLELGLSAAKEHTTPLGNKPRSEESVRRAAACLEKPQERIMWELWASGPGVENADQMRLPELYRALMLHFQLQKQQREEGLFDIEEFEALGDAWDDVLFSDDLYDEVEERADEGPSARKRPRLRPGRGVLRHRTGSGLAVQSALRRSTRGQL